MTWREIISNQERIKLRERISDIGPISIVISLKLFLERTCFPEDNISLCVASFVEGRGAKHVGSAGVAMNAQQRVGGFILP